MVGTLEVRLWSSCVFLEHVGMWILRVKLVSCQDFVREAVCDQSLQSRFSFLLVVNRVCLWLLRFSKRLVLGV